MTMPDKTVLIQNLVKFCDQMEDIYITIPSAKDSDVGDHKSKKILGVIYPKNEKATQALIKELNKLHKTIPIHIVSSGMNWGFGSHKGVCDEYLLVNMSDLDEIFSIDYETGIACIGSGTTQGQLSTKIANSRFLMNVTSASDDSSIVGNSLERGMGYLGPRVEDVLGLEVITGTGELIRLGGYWQQHDNLSLAFSYPYGLGPELLPLFFQSNFGVVTKAVIALKQKPEAFCMAKLLLKDNELPSALNAIRYLHSNKVCRSYFKIFDLKASQSYLSDSDSSRYMLYGDISSTFSLFDVIKDEIKQVFKKQGLFGIDYIEKQGIDKSNTEDLIYANFIGKTDVTKFICNLFEVEETKQIDTNDKYGWLMHMSAIPKTQNRLKKVVEIIDRIKTSENIHIGTTIKVSAKNYIDLVVQFKYERNASAATEAKALRNKLNNDFLACGLHAYRLDIEQQAIEKSTDHVQLIKHLFDPKGIISPGRYGIN